MKSSFLLPLVPIFLMGLLSSCASHTVQVTITHDDATTDSLSVRLAEHHGVFEYRLPVEQLEAVSSVKIVPDFARAEAGEDGFFLATDGMATYFKEREKNESRSIYANHQLRMQGVKTPRGCFAEMMDSYRFNAKTTFSYDDGVYTSEIEYELGDVEPYEDLVLRIYELKGDEASYSGMGRLYRKLYVEGKKQTLAERAEKNPLLRYAVDNPEIRIRQCWKPVPTPTGPDQTRENEPEVRVKVTFDRCCELVDALKSGGVPESQLTLVGWNLKGHDGRFPTVFPPEETLGGEPGLRHLIGYAQQNGFQIVPHICTGDSYRVSEDFDENDLAVMPDGGYDCKFVYGSGRMYKLCNKVAYEKFVQAVNDSLRAYGFRGIEYNDVYSIIPPIECCSPEHPLNAEESAEYARLILKDGADKIGGIGSEGGYDHVAEVLDFCLYTSMSGLTKLGTKMRDEYFPVWHIIYNGYIYSCPFSECVNYSIKDPGVSMKIQEYGCHPTFYFYSAHRDDTHNWMGNLNSDLLCGTEEELRTSVEAIRKGYDYLKDYGYIQYLTMDDHCSLADGVYRTLFSDGTVTVCNYSDAPFTYEGVEIAPESWKVLEPVLK